MKFLILCCYFKRPNMVRNALRSVRDQTHTDWHLAFVDDSGPDDQRGYQVLMEELPGPAHVTYYPVGDTEEQKRLHGSRFGGLWNIACAHSDADVALMLCDDDALHPQYLENLAAWFTANPEHKYCHSHVCPFNPFTHTPATAPPQAWWLNHGSPIAPSCVVDASQVAWRLPDMKASGIAFPEQQTANLDATLYAQMYAHWGACMPTNVIGQYKGVYDSALTYRQGREYQVTDLPEPPAPAAAQETPTPA